MTPKYDLFKTVDAISKICIDNEQVVLGQHVFKKSDIEYIEFIGKDYQNISGGLHGFFSSDGSNNKIVLRTANKEMSKKFLVLSEESFNQLSYISKQWKADGVNIKASFDLV